jgi:hypothetical protein
MATLRERRIPTALTRLSTPPQLSPRHPDPHYREAGRMSDSRRLGQRGGHFNGLRGPSVHRSVGADLIYVSKFANIGASGTGESTQQEDA